MTNLPQLSWHGLPIDGMTREQLIEVVRQLMMPVVVQLQPKQWWCWWINPPAANQLVEYKHGLDGDIRLFTPPAGPGWDTTNVYWRPAQ